MGKIFKVNSYNRGGKVPTPGPHWGPSEKKMTTGKVSQSFVCIYIIYILYNDYIIYIYYIITSRSLSRWHSSGSISNASTT